MVNGVPQQDIQAQQQQQPPVQATAQVPGQALEQADIAQATGDITSQIEEGLAQLPDDIKEALATFAIAPEFGELMGMLLSPEVGDFFTQFSDPSLTIVALPREELDAVLGTSVEAQEQATAEAPETIEGEITPEEANTAFGQPLPQ